MVDFQEIRERIPAKDAAFHYGIEIDRHGKSLCPFHDDHTPSLTYKGLHFTCWACGVHGDSIDFTSQLFGLNTLEAAQKLSHDFHVGVFTQTNEITRKRREQQIKKDFGGWKKRIGDELSAAFRFGHYLLHNFPPDGELTEQQALALRWHSTLEYYLDCLDSRDLKQQMNIFRQRKEIAELCSKILQPTQMR